VRNTSNKDITKPRSEYTDIKLFNAWACGKKVISRKVIIVESKAM
jgi:hypothetical protein